jgi:GDP-L-fucose synthase
MERVFIAGHRGMVGAALVREAHRRGSFDVITASRDQLDLCVQSAVFDFVAEEKPDSVIIAAAKVGGIYANATYPADFIYDNLAIVTNLIEGCRRAGVPRVLFLGSSCIYPKLASQPMVEDCLLTGQLEVTNEAYAIAKIAGLKLCQHYRAQHGLMYHSLMPTNLYGPGDNYHPENSHVIPAILRRFHEAKEKGAAEVTIWGTGTPRREFLHVDDLASACFHMLGISSPPDWVNVGFGSDITILDLAHLIAQTVGFNGTIITDTSKPDGTPRKLMDNSKIRNLGWTPNISLEEGLASAYQDFISTLSSGYARL